MFEFPSSRNAWRLDIVSILAVLGESSIKIHAQSITASRFCLLPRLLPAPQALLRESRPKRMPYVEEVTVYGANSGAKRDGLNFIPNLIHRVENLPAYSVRAVEIGWNSDHESVPVKYRTLAPLNVLALASFVLSVGLLAWAGIVRDGVAFIGVLLISCASSALGYASYWQRTLTHRPMRRSSPEEIILYTRWGAFLIVRCEQDVARALYWQPEECHYTSSSAAARLSGGVVGGLMVLVAVVLFANCSSWAMQAAIGTSYALLNVVYWLMTVVPEAWSWDLRCFNVRERQEFGTLGGPHRTFTSAVSSAIKVTRSTAWIRQNQILPR
ncbi:MAG: hypothetical protein Q9219_002899 [cf. Caloplaca sp. 3 TL-2023]